METPLGDRPVTQLIFFLGFEVIYAWNIIKHGLSSSLACGGGGFGLARDGTMCYTSLTEKFELWHPHNLAKKLSRIASDLLFLNR